MTPEEYEKTEELVMLKDGRVKQEGKKEAAFAKKGSTVVVSGIDKMQLLSSKMAKRADKKPDAGTTASK